MLNKLSIGKKLALIALVPFLLFLVYAIPSILSDSGDGASGAARSGIIVLLLALIAGGGLVHLVSKELKDSLAKLRDEATNVATSDLPRLADALSTGVPVAELASDREPLDMGDSEFGEVAASLTAIRDSASSVGERVSALQGGISDTFVNLARRNQSLIDRQLEAIDTLEAKERDSDRLALMYRVDHLATRMRRNAESLLVLADAKAPERHSPAVELREVLRVAIGEVEDYRRIVPISLDDLHVAGPKAQDLAHLLAEVMENAAQHSPPGTAVDVTGAFESTSGNYVVTILDHGTGVEAVKLMELNELLQRPPTSTLTISHSIGLQVVSRLSHSLGLRVTLSDVPDGGLVAKVTIPAPIVADWAQTAPSGATPPMPSAPAPAAPIAAAMAQPLTQGLPATGAGLPTPDAPAPLAAPAPVMPAPGDFDTTGLDLPAPDPVETIDMPGLDLPSLGSPDLGTPDLAAPDLGTPDIAGMSLPAPGMDAPAFDAPDLGTPDIADMAIPDMSIPDMSLPAPGLAEVSLPAPDMPVPEAPAFDAPASFDGAFAAPEAPDFATPDLGMPVSEAPAVAPDVFDPTPVVEAAPAVFDPAPAPAPAPMPEPVAEVPAPAPAPMAAPAPAPAPMPEPVAEMPAPAPAPMAAPAPAPMAAAPMAAPAPAPAAVPVAETAAPAPTTTPGGLTRRKRSSEPVEVVDLDADRTAPSQRTPDQVKNMLSRYKTGLERGRGTAETDGE